ncbi:3572_t:CDS:2 [Gigaspora margarita]|uniref:3572_t:CDS:1 n=1 Tax=Gigaspora margarita TaxID=4874 RepID=A0ABN7UNU5_GIGMA|nr:3572_t:CDS:2 [Gigaspora margarita]
MLRLSKRKLQAPLLQINDNELELIYQAMALKEIGCKSSDLMELKIKKCQQIKSATKQSLEKENLDDNECEKK